MAEGFLPVSKKDLEERGIGQLDFVYVCGDAYVDHSSFGAASSAGCWRPTASRSGSWRSRTGESPRA